MNKCKFSLCAAGLCCLLTFAAPAVQAETASQPSFGSAPQLLAAAPVKQVEVGSAAELLNAVGSNTEIILKPGDELILYTDGVTEAANRDLKLYGEERLKACMEANYKLAPEVLLRAVRSDIDDFAAGMEQYDDITMVLLKMR